MRNENVLGMIEILEGDPMAARVAGDMAVTLMEDYRPPRGLEDLEDKDEVLGRWMDYLATARVLFAILEGVGADVEWADEKAKTELDRLRARLRDAEAGLRGKGNEGGVE